MDLWVLSFYEVGLWYFRQMQEFESWLRIKNFLFKKIIFFNPNNNIFILEFFYFYFRNITVGVANWEAHTNVYVGLGAQPKEELLFGQARPKTKRDDQPSESAHQTTSWKRISIKKERDKKTWKYLRESCCYCIKYSATKLNLVFQPLQPLPTTLGRGWWDKYQHYKSKPTRGVWRWEEDSIK